MDKEQTRQYGESVDKWLKAVEAYGTGWDEDGPEIPVDYEIDVDMVHYNLGGLFELPLGASHLPGMPERALIATPRYDILCRVRKVKAHMNRMITAMEYAHRRLDEARTALPVEAGVTRGVDLWDHVKLATEMLQGAHHGTRFRTIASGQFTTPMKAHVTLIPSSQHWRVSVGYQIDTDKGPRYLFKLATTVFTTCPFVLFETKGKHSHTQRTHIEIELDTETPVVPAGIMREINVRLVPVMSAMKIPDEVVQVCKSYAGPTFTEDAAVRVVKILRGITAEFTPGGGSILRCYVKAVSEDSHLAHDIVTSLECDINT